MLNEKSIKRLENSEFGKAYGGVRKALENLSKELENIGGALGSLALYFHEDEDLRIGEFVPFIMIGVVKSDSLIDGDEIAVDWVED